MVIRKPKTVDFWRGDLPHWQVEDGRYFVTIHLSGAIPEAGRDRIRKLGELFRNLDKNDDYLKLSRKIFSEMDRWLDQTSPATHFKRSELAEIVVEYRQRSNVWEMFAYVVMPSHLHLFFELNENLSLKHELEEFKRWTGHRASKVDPLFSDHRFWQSEWFDHWSRSDEEDEKIVRYIENNPVKAGLATSVGQYPFCDKIN